MSATEPLKEMTCQNEGCTNHYMGTRQSRYCPSCRYIVRDRHRAEGFQRRKEGIVPELKKGYIMATCPTCGAKHPVNGETSTKWRFCPLHEYKRHSYDMRE